MDQYNILFESSKIEYITPFLKLWMSFNNRYKKEYPTIKSDAEAIKECKKEWKLKTTFIRLLELNSTEWILLKDGLYCFFRNLQNYELKNKDGGTLKIKSIIEGKDRRSGKTPIFLKGDSWFQYFDEEKDILFQEYLDAIYQVRCNLVHWSFDINNQYFISLIKESYNILYPILESIFENEPIISPIYHCMNKERFVSSRCEFIWWKFKVLLWSHIAKGTVSSFPEKNKIKRNAIMAWKYEDQGDYLELKENIEFDSPSWASTFCLGMNSNWWNEWKNEEGKTMSDVLRNN